MELGLQWSVLPGNFHCAWSQLLWLDARDNNSKNKPPNSSTTDTDHVPLRQPPITSLTAKVQGWPEPYIYGVYTVYLAGKSPNIRCIYTYIYGSGQPYIYTVFLAGIYQIYGHIRCICMYQIYGHIRCICKVLASLEKVDLLPA